MFDVHVPEFMTGVKAPALISRLVTVTLWSLLEDHNPWTIHVFNINIHYLQLVIFFNEVTTDIKTCISLLDDKVITCVYLMFAANWTHTWLDEKDENLREKNIWLKEQCVMFKGYVLFVTFYQILFSEELFIYQVTG